MWWAPGAVLVLAVSGCQTGGGEDAKPLPLVDNVDLPRFMGDWYVIANMPTFIEKGAYNAVESYALNEDGTIATTFTFNKGAFDGPKKQYHPKGFVRDGTGKAEWGMQFLWPFKATYMIIHLDDDYGTTIIGVPSRSYVWVMARTPEIPVAKYDELVAFLRSVDYDVSQLQKVPQQPLGER
jgi:apolipoprotein D and lipocalin family protein